VTQGHDQPTHMCVGFLQAFMGLTLEHMQALQLFNLNPLVILLKFTKKSIIKLNASNGPYILMDALAPPSPVVSPLLVVPPFLVAPQPLVFLLPFIELMPKVIVAPLGAIIPLMI